MATPLVTVYVTNHNYGSYIEESLQSIKNQEFQDFELIIIDDGSTDDSLEKIEKYNKMENTHIVRQKNKGLVVSNNIALKLAVGKYIMRLDADDYLDPRALEIMVNTLEKNDDLALVFPDYYEIDESGEIIQQVRRHNFEKDVTLFDQPAHGACTMIRRKVLLEIGGYDETHSRQDGYDLWLNIINSYSVKNINLPLFYYRQHGKSLTTNESKLLKTRSKIIAKHAKKMAEKTLSVLAVIPVRGSAVDSRSLPLKELNQKPLIDWTIDAAMSSTTIKHLMLSTPDKEVLQHVKSKYGTEIILHEREPDLARINQKLFKTIINSLEYYCNTHNKPDAILILNIEAPFRSAMYIDKAVHMMQLYDVDSVIGVSLEDDIFYVHDGSGLQPLSSDNGLRLERNDIYRKIGGITLVSEPYFSNQKQITGGKMGHINMDQKAKFTIQSDFDWSIAEAIYQ